MSALGLFVVGAIVTVVVGIAMGLLIWAAIQDGRVEARRKANRRVPGDMLPSPPRSPRATT